VCTGIIYNTSTPRSKTIRNIILSPFLNKAVIVWNNRKIVNTAYRLTYPKARIPKILRQKAVLLEKINLLGCYAASNGKDSDVSDWHSTLNFRVHSTETKVFLDYLNGVISHNAQRRPRGGRLRLKCDGARAETRFRLSAKRTSPFKSAGASVPSTTGSRGVRHQR